MRSGQTAVALQGQVLAGSQYPGQHAGMLGLQQHPGQHLLAGTAEEVPVRDERKCTKTRVVDGREQHCNSWAVKNKEPKLCIGHHRELEALTDGDEPTGDQGSHQASS